MYILATMAARRVLISIDERLLGAVDRTAARKGLSRSGYLAELATRDLGANSGPGVDPAVRAAMHSLDELFAAAPSFDAGDAIRAVRGRG
jgi:hypothetical protein